MKITLHNIFTSYLSVYSKDLTTTDVLVQLVLSIFVETKPFRSSRARQQALHFLLGKAGKQTKAKRRDNPLSSDNVSP